MTFLQVTVEEAQEALREQESVIRSVARQGSLPVISISLDDATFRVETEDGHPVTSEAAMVRPTEEMVRTVGVMIGGESYDFRLSVEKEA